MTTETDAAVAVADGARFRRRPGADLGERPGGDENGRAGAPPARGGPPLWTVRDAVYWPRRGDAP